MKNLFKRSYISIRSLKIFLFIFLGYSVVGFASENSINSISISKIQEKTITGVVKDKDQNPLPGVTIQVKGTLKGTTTDFDGNYKLKVEGTDTLVFSYLGYTTKEVLVGSKTSIPVVLYEDVAQLEEIVVIGYGTVKKKDLTGSVSIVGGKDISERKTPQIATALQGSVAGVTVTRNNGPGAGGDIRIRGITNLSNSAPLTIIDGVPGSLSDINPNDIESLSVLKDAASASIYGARAASGVILVTTKRAKTGQSSFEYNYEYGFDTPTKLPNTVEVTRYLEIENELQWNDNPAGGEFQTNTKEEIENYVANNKLNPDQYPITDWESLILRNNAPRESHRFSYTKGTKNIKTKFSAVYDKIEALYDNRVYKRLTTRLNNNVNISDKLKATIDIAYKRTFTDQPNSNPLGATRTYAPIYAALWADGRIAEGKQGSNAYAPIYNGGFNKDWYNSLRGNFSITYEPVKDFTIKAVVSPNLTFDKGKSLRSPIPYYASDDPSNLLGYIEGYGEASGKLSEIRNDGYEITKQLLLNYNKSLLDRHNFHFLLGYEDFESFSESLGASREQFELTNFPYLNLGPENIIGNSGSASETAYRSYFGRLSYNYKNKYFLQSNIRTDITSRFHKDHRSATFPSVSLGWVVSEEEFMKNQKLVSFLKLRASYGELGNERVGNFLYQSLISFGDQLFYQGNDIVSKKIASENREAIENLTWETTTTKNIAVDVSFLDNRLNFTGEYYDKETTDMLLNRSIFDYIGKTDPLQNTGTMNTKGWETEISWKDKIGEVGYSIAANLSDARTKMGDLAGQRFLGDKVKIEGSEFNEWFGYVSDGLYENQADLDEGVLNNKVSIGDVKYVDQLTVDTDGDGIFDASDGKIDSADKVLLGGSLPRYQYGGNIKLDYKGFSFGLVFQGVGKRNVRVTSTMVRPLNQRWQNVPELIDGKYWSNYNTDEQNANAIYPRVSFDSAGNNYAMSDFWMFNGAYLRIKNISLGYTLPKSFVDSFNLKNVRVYVTGSDLLSIDNYPDGWDPEASADYPITKTFVFGATIKF